MAEIAIFGYLENILPNELELSNFKWTNFVRELPHKKNFRSLAITVLKCQHREKRRIWKSDTRDQ